MEMQQHRVAFRLKNYRKKTDGRILPKNWRNPFFYVKIVENKIKNHAEQRFNKSFCGRRIRKGE